MSDWKIFKGNAEPHNDIASRLPTAPPWRDFSRARELRGLTFQASPEEIDLVNAALYLRRPLLVTGSPGNGKSSLAYAVAQELKLGSVLRWSINSRSNIQQGLYAYDAIARLRDANLAQLSDAVDRDRSSHESHEDIGRYIRLGPLGTALLPDKNPRVLLIDEFDKSDIDLPNDLLHVFEEGEFEIQELTRIADHTSTVRVLPYDGSSDEDKVAITAGRIQCESFPFVVLTSNGERDLPPAFLRRCLRLDITDPDKEKLEKIVSAHLNLLEHAEPVEELLQGFVQRRDEGNLLATDQLLNAIFLVTQGRLPEGEERQRVLDAVLRVLGRR